MKSIILPTIIVLIILTIIPLLSYNALNAQPPEEDIKLPDIIILGETERLIDTISLDERLRPYWNLTSLKRFEYEPYLEPEPLEPYEETIKERRGLVSLHAGNRSYLRFRARFHDPARPLLSFYADLENREIVKDRLSRNFRAGWLPEIKDTGFALEVENNLFSERYETDNFDDYLYQIEQSGLSLSVTRESFDLTFLVIDELYFRAAYNMYEDKRLYDLNSNDPYLENEVDDLDLYGSTLFHLPASDLSIPLEVALVRRDTPGINTGVRKNNFLIFDHIGFNVLADRYALMPAISFHSKLDLNSFFRIIAANEPLLDTQTRLELLQDNPDQDLDVEKRLVKTHLNASLTLENDRLIPLSVSYNFRYHKDYNYYDSIQDGFYFNQNRIDIYEHLASLSLAYHYRYLIFRNVLEYRQLEKELPFHATWQNSITIGWFADDFMLRGDLRFLAERQNIAGEDMPDVALLSFAARKRILNSLSIEASVENVLSEPYRKYELSDNEEEILTGYQIPEEPLHFRAGLIWRF